MIYCNEGQSRTINFGPIENCLNTLTSRWYDSLTAAINKLFHLPVCQYRYFPKRQSFKLFPLTGTFGPFWMHLYPLHYTWSKWSLQEVGTCTVCLCFALIGSQDFNHEYTSPISTCAGFMERSVEKGNKSYQFSTTGISSDKIQILSTCDNDSEVTSLYKILLIELKVAEFPKLALIHGILLSLLI